MGIAHWDEVEKGREERGQMAGTWSSLGTAAGSWRAGANRIELAPGEQPTPPHVHGDAEEIFYVLGGSGLTLLDDKAYEIRAGDCIVYKNFHEAHTIRAGDDGLDVIAFGAREYLGYRRASARPARCGRSRASSRSRKDIPGTASRARVAGAGSCDVRRRS